MHDIFGDHWRDLKSKFNGKTLNKLKCQLWVNITMSLLAIPTRFFSFHRL
uniref:Uncharacterized protein n=1 Tax=Anguilla anguilla TaxID=7936 RepID=A0A0E9SRL1_ANGAN